MKRPWIAFFSQTGSEIVDISKSLKRWPDVIITNERPSHLRTINLELLEENLLVTTSNKPTEKELLEIIEYYDNPIITLHGWLRIMPPNICNEYKIYNGHPGLITDFPELKGKDPQIRAFEGIKQGKYQYAGAVLHKVVAGVDEGKVLLEERFNTFEVELDDLFRILRDRSLYMWCKFLKEVL
jgi:folate-dependent phosphoribosylglycinamide formyltransferase PurN